MKQLSEMTSGELNAFYDAVLKEYEACKAEGLELNMARGKPSKAQLELSNELLTIIDPANCTMDGIDARNYGTLEGLPSCRKLFAEILDVNVEEVFVGGSASLNLMYDVIAKAFTHGFSIETIAKLLKRSVPAVRHLLKLGYCFKKTGQRCQNL